MNQLEKGLKIEIKGNPNENRGNLNRILKMVTVRFIKMTQEMSIIKDIRNKTQTETNQKVLQQIIKNVIKIFKPHHQRHLSKVQEIRKEEMQSCDDAIHMVHTKVSIV